jgi:CheY-like chemotaxis protein
MMTPDEPAREKLALAGRRVLVADDNPVNRTFAARLLKQLGCTVALAEDGHQAEQMHAQTCYDLILMDCDMPRMDGYEATRCIRRTEGEKRRTPIVALTACVSPEGRENCIAAGMDDFIAKPAQKQELARALVRWLSPMPVRADDSSSETRDELEAVREMFGKDFAELAVLYLTDSPVRLDALRAAGTANDAVQTAKLAHAFSGSCASIGASALSRMCREMEGAAKSGPLREFKQRMVAIEVEHLRISERLRTLLQ